MTATETPTPESELTAETVEIVNAAITDRLLDFHEALVDRGQIPPIPPEKQWPIYAKDE